MKRTKEVKRTYHLLPAACSETCVVVTFGFSSSLFSLNVQSQRNVISLKSNFSSWSSPVLWTFGGQVRLGSLASNFPGMLVGERGRLGGTKQIWNEFLLAVRVALVAHCCLHLSCTCSACALCSDKIIYFSYIFGYIFYIYFILFLYLYFFHWNRALIVALPIASNATS